MRKWKRGTRMWKNAGNRVRSSVEGRGIPNEVYLRTGTRIVAEFVSFAKGEFRRAANGRRFEGRRYGKFVESNAAESRCASDGKDAGRRFCFDRLRRESLDQESIFGFHQGSVHQAYAGNVRGHEAASTWDYGGEHGSDTGEGHAKREAVRS